MTGVRNTAVNNLAHRLFLVALVLTWSGAVTLVLIGGLDYYLTPLQERPFSELYELHKPSGNIGHGLGIVGSAFLVLGVCSYILRKRIGLLARAGRLSTWLEVHIFLCTLGPALVLFHTTFKFGGIVSIAFGSMSIVALSGVFGRYLYGRVPKTIHGQFRSLESIRQQAAELIKTVSEEFGLSAEQTNALLPRSERTRARGFAHALVLAIQYDFSRRSLKRRVRKLLSRTLSNSDDGYSEAQTQTIPRHSRNAIVKLLQARLQLEQQIVLLEPFQRLFGYWHLLHLPLATVMFLIMFVHIAVAVLFGYTWVF